MTAPAAEFLTPRAASLSLRGATDPARERQTARGEPLLVTERLPDGFIEVDIDGERWLALSAALETWRGAHMPPAVPEPLARAGDAPLPDPARAAAITPPPGARAPMAATPKRQLPPWWAFVVGGLLAFSAITALTAATGWWKTATGWVVCENGARIQEWEYQDGKMWVMCDGFNRPRKWFRE